MFLLLPIMACVRLLLLLDEDQEIPELQGDGAEKVTDLNAWVELGDGLRLVRKVPGEAVEAAATINRNWRILKKEPMDLTCNWGILRELYYWSSLFAAYKILRIYP